jgi:hypothetical protein
VRQEQKKVRARLTGIIAEREFWLEGNGRRRKKVYLRFRKPFKQGSQNFVCVFHIEGLHEKTVTRRIGGYDGVQALDLALQIAHMELVCSDAYEQGRLTLMGSYDFALPVAEGLKSRIKTGFAPRRRPTAAKRGQSKR